jgi:TonB family protein
MPSLEHTGRRGGASLGRWVALAVLLHGELALLIGLALYFWAPRQADIVARQKAQAAAEPIEVSTVDDDTARRLIADMEREEERVREEQRKKEEESPDAPGQVVDLARPREERRPDEARFAAEYDSAVAKETRRFGKFDRNALQRSPGDSDLARPSLPALSPREGSGPSAAGALAMRLPPGRSLRRAPGPSGAETSDDEASETEALKSDPDGALARPGGTRARRSPFGAAPQYPGPLGTPGPLLPSEEQLARAIGSGTQDHLKDIEEGEETALNAKKWRFASFFNRVKEQVRDRWRPAEEYRRRDPTGAIYGQQDRYTSVRVQLRPDGSLAKISIMHPSGLDFLDDLAIEAFKEAQPFPNPPQKLVDRSGVIDFQFGFFFELSGAPRMFYRYRPDR